MDIKKTVLSLFTIGVVATLALVSTKAFFNDTETSTGNILQAGALDLKIDNTCYYNGQACTDGHFGGPNGPTCSCTWTSKNLDEGSLFFNLTDLKPGDWEEDTISLHVDNPSWICVNTKLTSNDDFSCTDPEKADDPNCGVPNPEPNTTFFDGDLAQNVNFVFWHDDGDNVLETGETVIQQGQGPATTVLNSSWPIADSTTGGGPIPAGQDVFIGKAFCFGTIGLSPVAPGTNSPVGPITNSGITCNGATLNNASQTDRATADISFEAVQARHNDAFRCQQPATPP